MEWVDALKVGAVVIASLAVDGLWHVCGRMPAATSSVMLY
jgi:hypothetical protein